MPLSIDQLAEQIHQTPTLVTLAISGGGSRAIADLLEAPGASRTVLEAAVPYSEAAMIRWLGSRPDQFCSAPTARAMALVALERARQGFSGDRPAAGIACTASLASDRPKRGPHRAHVAVQTVARTAVWSIEMQKDCRSRREEEELVRRMVLNAVADACGLAPRLELPLRKSEAAAMAETKAPQPWQDLVLGKTEAVFCQGRPQSTAVVFPGAFNPLHTGHRRMAEAAAELLGTPPVVEISIRNVDKLPLDYAEIERRLRQFPPEQGVWLTRAATFEEKSRLFPGATFVVGVDTLRRIGHSRYYGDDSQSLSAAVARIAGRGCRFLVFGRALDNAFLRLADLDLPEALLAICREVPPERFREDVSSTAIRRSETS